MITLGIKNLISGSSSQLKGKRIGLLCNQASTDENYIHSRDLISEAFPGQLSCLFTPQHGFFAEKQDNMIESAHSRDREENIPIYSLYGELRRPSPEMLASIDVLIIDLTDVGTRVYTFMSTMAYCLEEAGRLGKKILVLDRPNPINGDSVEGNIISGDCFSFVGLFPLPMRHGMTMGELSLYMNAKITTPADLEVVTMTGWQRGMHYPDTGLPWIYPSPNMPTFLTSLVYPGQVLWEGTNISEGRGTTLPFEIFGAPFIDIETIRKYLKPELLAGCILRSVAFEPTSNKWQGEMCKGFHLHVTDYRQFKPYRTSLALLQAIACCFPKEFAFKEPPYEYEFERLPLDLIIGDKDIRKAVLEGRDILEVERQWQEQLSLFLKERVKFLLY